MVESTASRDRSLWNFAVTIYSVPGVAEECLELQDRYGVDVSFLLFCAWIAWSRKIALTVEDFAATNALVNSWHQSVVKPLRSARRYMKGLPDGDVMSLRKQVKGLELEAERIELAMLFSFAEDRWSHAGNEPVSTALRSNLELFLRNQSRWGETGEYDPAPRLIAAVLALDDRS